MGGIFGRLRRMRGFSGLMRLAGDSAGNVMAMVAAALIPITGFVGCGVDMGRGYLAQARMQQACDAAALAGRRAMTTGSVDTTVRAEALKFFVFNFPTGTPAIGQTAAVPAAFGADPFTPTVSDGADSAVVVTASTKASPGRVANASCRWYWTSLDAPLQPVPESAECVFRSR